ncbi:hypothetical protein HYALB_00006519 [Hymenoscyphus albidus]|uniref:Uncharacterized protein n=1 Tax=Hymenoscyphus albidus TaxID=595503 RepID=A0A9N9Q5X8_9HELO|nr:hypothetical protein HYALB_00006519 [Hymenoscyphus albidus]
MSYDKRLQKPFPLALYNKLQKQNPKNAKKEALARKDPDKLCISYLPLVSEKLVYLANMRHEVALPTGPWDPDDML